MTKIVGGCLCGAVRYRAEANTKPAMTGVCHCRDCQKQTGSSFSILIAVPKGTIHFEGEPLASFETKSGDGRSVLRRFCPKCGSPIASVVEATPRLDWIKAGTLDDTSWLQPQVNMWCETAQPWINICEDIPRFPRNPPMKP
ncbi:GFA family protein [Azomonas macrocytogenes]|uniref:CENP-V/GFA domain-containing protein n=1 Tax=Azomonas macrocytogenes TaxID=69962 RepID=A0A839SYH0_AZOMA|nr:GFA family protein [Azomonas macrocytogenes]MBB3102172.1 hypothetical protein [Azomonas macrocytogenes]